MSSPALTVIGLDGATLDVIDPLLEAGELPNLGRLFRRGNRGELRSTIHPLTPLAWTTMVTGVNAGRHGVWDFLERYDGGYRLRFVNGSHRRAPALWDVLSASGRRVGIMNVPFSWPAGEVEGFMVAGLDAAARDAGMTHPPELLAELRQRFGGTLELDHSPPLRGDGSFDLGAARRACEQKVDAALWLAERFDPELLFVVFMAADHAHHLTWPGWEARGAESELAEVYRMLDDAVGALAGAAGADRNVLVVSDHGGGSLRGVLNLNAWLAREGFLTYADPSRLLVRGELGRALIRKLFEQKRRLPQGLRRYAKQRVPKLREQAYRLRDFTIVDWSRTRAFGYSTFGNVVINLGGREQQGIVEPGAEYERVRDEIAERALELRGPGGERIVATVHRREELYHGPELEKVPDLIVEFLDYAWLGRGNLRKRTPGIWEEPDVVGSHRLDGIVALAGPAASTGASISARIEDIAPTILYLLGEPIPAGFEGRLIAEAIDPALADSRPPEYRDDPELEVAAREQYGADQVGDVEQRLRELGYIE